MNVYQALKIIQNYNNIKSFKNDRRNDKYRFFQNFDPNASSVVDELFHRLSIHSLEGLEVVTSRDQFFSRFEECSSSALTLQHFDRYSAADCDNKLYSFQTILKKKISRY